VYKLSGGTAPSQTERDTARADYARVVANVAQAEAQVAQARANVSTNCTNLAKGKIYAPVTGVVLSGQVEPRPDRCCVVQRRDSIHDRAGSLANEIAGES
jgi:HlyD family secretion protein